MEKQEIPNLNYILSFQNDLQTTIHLNIPDLIYQNLMLLIIVVRLTQQRTLMLIYDISL